MNIEIKNRFTGKIIINGADLREADLLGANLRGADLREADLLGANLYGANLPIVHIKGTANLLQYLTENITIGCEFHSLEYWLIMYDVIGRENNYTESQIEEYGNYIKSIKNMMR